MKKYLFSIGLFLLLFLTTGCQKTIIGKWKVIDEENEYYFIFNKDKTCSYEMTVARLDCTYEDDGSHLTILYNGYDETNTYEYYFQDNTLIIKDSTGIVNKFIKQ